MARKIRAKDVLRELASGASQNEASRALRVSKHSVADVRRAAEAAGLTWEDVRDCDDALVYETLFPGRNGHGPAYEVPDWAEVHRELARVGVTLRLLHAEYREANEAAGRVSMSYDRFCKLYQRWLLERGATSRVARKAGQVLEVDWAGQTVPLVDHVTGEAGRAYLFVACLPFSRYMYAEAAPDMGERSWLTCHVHMYGFLGGSTPILRPDNLKTGVESHPRDGEVALNPAYRSLAEHYHAAVIPARVRKPRDKAGAENSVWNASTMILAALRDSRFETVGQLNEAIRPLLDELNARPFQKREGSRLQVFREEELPAMRPLPQEPYEVCEWVRGRKVQVNCHVTYRRNHYSAPRRLVGATVDLRVGESVLEIWHGDERVATHPLFPAHARNRYSTQPEHVPQGEWSEWDRPRVEAWAARVGPSCAECVARIYASVSFDEQALSPALSLLRLSGKYAAPRLEEACRMALASGCRSPRYAQVSGILKSGQDKRGEEPAPVEERGGYVRGASYYGGGAE